jgi:hypothetical protein
MLSSLRDLDGGIDVSNGNIASPILEPIRAPADLDEHGGGGEETSPTPLEQLNFHAQEMTNVGDNDDEGDDDLPALQSISNSSDSEDGHEGQLDAGSDRSMTALEHGIDGRMDGRERTSHRLRFRSPNGTLHTCEVSANVSSMPIGRTPEETSAVPTASTSCRFSTTIDTEEARMIIDVDDGGEGHTLKDGSDNEDDPDSGLILPLRARTPTLPEPPFVTDGRGRVIWSSSGVNKTVDHGSMTERINQPSHTAAFLFCPPSHSSTSPISLDEQLHDVFCVLPDDASTTNGRRVINVGCNDEEVVSQPDVNIAPGTSPASAPSRSLFGRMFDALF